MKAVILAGGLGTRLRPLTDKKPKPMLPLGKKPLLEHLIKWIKKNGVKDIVLCVSYLHETIEKHFGDGSKWGVKIKYLEEFKNYTREEIFEQRKKKFLNIGRQKSFITSSKDEISLVEKDNFFVLIKRKCFEYKNRLIIAFLLFVIVGLFLI